MLASDMSQAYVMIDSNFLFGLCLRISQEFAKTSGKEARMRQYELD